MRQEIAETKLASVSYANRRKRSVSNGGRDEPTYEVYEREEDGEGSCKSGETRRNETSGPDEGQCQVLEIPRNG